MLQLSVVPDTVVGELAGSVNSKPLLLITADVVPIEVIHNCTVDNMFQEEFARYEGEGD